MNIIAVKLKGENVQIIDKERYQVLAKSSVDQLSKEKKSTSVEHDNFHYYHSYTCNEKTNKDVFHYHDLTLGPTMLWSLTLRFSYMSVLIDSLFFTSSW